jgi:hypothetical protein
MADPPPYPDTGSDAGEESDRESTSSGPGADRARDQKPASTGSLASKVVIAIVAALVVVVVILHLTGVIGHGAH